MILRSFEDPAGEQIPTRIVSLTRSDPDWVAPGHGLYGWDVIFESDKPGDFRRYGRWED
jgi:hypothetical protein